jgi:hypothetical protein
MLWIAMGIPKAARRPLGAGRIVMLMGVPVQDPRPYTMALR